jgi:hypothetical protein
MMVAAIVNVIAAALNMSTAIVHALPVSPSPKIIIVIDTHPGRCQEAHADWTR